MINLNNTDTPSKISIPHKNEKEKKESPRNKISDLFIDVTSSLKEHTHTSPRNGNICSKVKNTHLNTLQQSVKKIAELEGFDDNHTSMLCSAAAADEKTFLTIVKTIQENADSHLADIYKQLLVKWDENHASEMAAIIFFLSQATSEAMLSYRFFFNEIRNWRTLLKKDLISHLSVYENYGKHYKLYSKFGKTGEEREHLKKALQKGIFPEFLAAYKTAGKKNNAGILKFLKDLLDHIPAEDGEREDSLAPYRYLLRLAATNKLSADSRLLKVPPAALIRGTLLFLKVEADLQGINMPDLDAFVAGAAKDETLALKLLKIFKDISQNPQDIFLDWASTDNKETVGDILLELSPEWISKNKKDISMFLSILNNTKTEIIGAPLARMLTTQKLPYLMTLCKWIQEGEKKLANAISLLYSSNDRVETMIGLWALKNDISMAYLFELLSLLKPAELSSFKLGKKTCKLTEKQKKAIANSILAEACGQKGYKATKALLKQLHSKQRHQELESRQGADPLSQVPHHLQAIMSHLYEEEQQKQQTEKTAAELLFMLPQEQQTIILGLCLAGCDTQKRTHLLRIFANYPSLPFIKLASTFLPDDVKTCLENIPDPEDLPQIIRVFTAVANKTPLYRYNKNPINSLNYKKVLKALADKEPSLLETINILLTDRSCPLRNAMLCGIIDWFRYGYAKELVVLFTEFPLSSRKTPQREIDPEQENRRKAAAIRLECGRLGYIEDVMKAVKTPQDDILARLIDACHAFEEPQLLRQILSCNPMEDETFSIFCGLLTTPHDPWYRFLLHIKSMKTKESCTPYITASPLSTQLLRRLVKNQRPFLAQQLVTNKNRKHTLAYLNKSSNDNASSSTATIKNVWHASSKRALEGRKGNRTSLLAYKKFQASKQSEEQHLEVALGLAIAQYLIDDHTCMPVQRLNQVIPAIPKAIINTDHGKHLILALRSLSQSIDVRDRIISLDNSLKLSPIGSHIINRLLSRDINHPITLKEVKLTLLSALLCRFRQSSNVGSCFSTAEAIRLPNSPEGLTAILTYYLEILSEGRISVTNIDQNKIEYLHASPSHIESEYGLPITHPLAKVFEYTLAARGIDKQSSNVIKARNLTFNDGNFLDSILSPVFTEYAKNHPLNPITCPDFLRNLRNCFDRNTLELFNPYIQDNDRQFSGWSFVFRYKLQEIKNINEYLHVYQYITKETLKSYRETITSFAESQLLDAIEQTILPYFDSTNPLSNTFIEYLRTNLSLKKKRHLWQRDAGGHQEGILASYIQRNNYPHFTFPAKSIKHAFGHILQYCANLPLKIQKIAAAEPLFYLPMSVPSHSINLTPHSILKLLKQYGSEKQVLKGLEEKYEHLTSQTLDRNTYLQLFHSICKKTTKMSSAIKPDDLEAILTQHLFENTSIKEFAAICLKEITLACAGTDIELETIIKAIDTLIWKIIEKNKDEVLHIFADANWRTEKYGNIFLAFGWSFAAHKLGVFSVTKNMENISPLDWEVVNINGWELYAPLT